MVATSVLSVGQEVRKGFTWGKVTIAPLLEEEEEDTGAAGGPSVALPVKPNDHLVIPFQNENLYAYILSANGEEKVRALWTLTGWGRFGHPTSPSNAVPVHRFTRRFLTSSPCLIRKMAQRSARRSTAMVCASLSWRLRDTRHGQRRRALRVVVLRRSGECGHCF